MNNQEALQILKDNINILISTGDKEIEASKYCDILNALDMAMKSLVAWDYIINWLEQMVIFSTDENMRNVKTDEPYIDEGGKCYQRALHVIKAKLEELRYE